MASAAARIAQSDPAEGATWVELYWHDVTILGHAVVLASLVSL